MTNLGVNERELTTSEVAGRCGVSIIKLNSWRKGLRLAPQGRPGRQSFWSQAAYAEAKAYADHIRAADGRRWRKPKEPAPTIAAVGPPKHESMAPAPRPDKVLHGPEALSAGPHRLGPWQFKPGQSGNPNGRPKEPKLKFTKTKPAMGWLCPLCRGAHSPYVKSCPEQPQ